MPRAVILYFGPIYDLVQYSIVYRTGLISLPEIARSFLLFFLLSFCLLFLLFFLLFFSLVLILLAFVSHGSSPFFVSLSLQQTVDSMKMVPAVLGNKSG